MAIEQKDRRHTEFWFNADALAPYGISSIRLGVVAYSAGVLGASSAYIRYEYANYDRCQQELKAIGGSVL